MTSFIDAGLFPEIGQGHCAAFARSRPFQSAKQAPGVCGRAKQMRGFQKAGKFVSREHGDIGMSAALDHDCFAGGNDFIPK